MNIALDTETQGLSGDLILACTMRENGKYKLHKDKDTLWEELIQIARSEAKRGKGVYVYIYNAAFDFYKIVNWNMRGII